MTDPSKSNLSRNTDASDDGRVGARFRPFSSLSSLSFRLFVWLAGFTVVAFGTYAYLTIRTTSSHWRDAVHKEALRSSAVISSSTYYGMLLNRKEDVHQIIRTVADAPGVVGVSIYDKNGTVIFSDHSDEIGHRVDLRAEACVICHVHDEPLHSLPTSDRVRVYRNVRGERVLGLINPIVNRPECSTAECHAHPPEQTILGVLDVKMSMADADAGLAAVTRQLITAAVLATLLIGLVSALFINLVVRRPVRKLIAGTERVARGDLESEIGEGGSEIGQLARAFNHMTRDLRRAREEITQWSRTLERKVIEKTEELGRTQRQIVQMEKMASLGKLAATVAHELNNPLAGILNYAKLIARDLEEDGDSDEKRADDLRFAKFIQKEAGRCGEIVRNLLLFSRQSKTELAAHSLNQIVERASMLVRHHLEMANVRLETRLLENDTIVCDANQIQQALVALFINAVEAMTDGDDPGHTLTVAVDLPDHPSPADDLVQVTVADTGAGIDPEILPQIFEPFFSTKSGTSEVGLGLAVVYGIVQRHGGSIDVESRVGEGTVFRISLPRRRPPAPSNHERGGQEK